MISYLCRRLIIALPSWCLVGLVAFLIIHLTPGDPAAVMLGQEATLKGVEEVRRRLGLDKPLIIQLKDWYIGIFRGDLGDSFFLGRPVAIAIWERIPTSFTLALCAMVIAVSIGVPLGIIAALRANTIMDLLAMIVSLVGLSTPEFLMGLGLIYVFSVTLRWFPSGGFVSFTTNLIDGFRHIALPALSLGFIQSALIARTTRAVVLDILNEDYVRTARAKGLAEQVVVWKHVLRNALLPIITTIGTAFALLLGGVFITEAVFRLPGMGSLVIAAVKRRDYPVVQGALLIVATFIFVVNLIVDLLYAYLDPRIKYD